MGYSLGLVYLITLSFKFKLYKENVSLFQFEALFYANKQMGYSLGLVYA